MPYLKKKKVLGTRLLSLLDKNQASFWHHAELVCHWALCLAQVFAQVTLKKWTPSVWLANFRNMTWRNFHLSIWFRQTTAQKMWSCYLTTKHWMIISLHCFVFSPCLLLFLLKECPMSIGMQWHHLDAFHSALTAHDSLTPFSLINSLLRLHIFFCISVTQSIWSNGLLARLSRCSVQSGHFPQSCGCAAPRFHLTWLKGCNLLAL